MLRLFAAKRLYVQEKWGTYFPSIPKYDAHFLLLLDGFVFSQNDSISRSQALPGNKQHQFFKSQVQKMIAHLVKYIIISLFFI